MGMPPGMNMEALQAMMQVRRRARRARGEVPSSPAWRLRASGPPAVAAVAPDRLYEAY